MEASHGVVTRTFPLERAADHATSERAKRFYADTIGWSFEAMPMPEGATYWVAKMDGKPVGRDLSDRPPGIRGRARSWMSYLAVDDVDARVKKAIAAGAKLMKPDLRRAECRPDRDPDRARRRRRRLDDAGRMIDPGVACNRISRSIAVAQQRGVEHEALWISALAQHLEGPRRGGPSRHSARTGIRRSDQGRLAHAGLSRDQSRPAARRRWSMAISSSGNPPRSCSTSPARSRTRSGRTTRAPAPTSCAGKAGSLRTGARRAASR